VRKPRFSEDQTKAIYQAFLTYLDTWLCERDVEGTCALNGPAVHGFGTGADETVYVPADVRAVIERDIKQMPGAFEYRVLSSQVTPLTAEVGIVAAELNVFTLAHHQQLSLNGMRLSMVFRRIDASWKLEHMHGSFPATVHGDDEPWPVKELEDREAVLQRMVDERTHELEQARQNMERLATTDTLTGLNNRMKMDTLLRSELERVGRGQRGLAVIMYDIDHFKAVNDDYGHTKGDEVLIKLSRLVEARIRNTDALGRWGGEEFLLVCPLTSLEEAQKLAETLRERIAQTDFGLNRPLTASFGVAEYRAGDTVETLIHRADIAMYRAKKEGRNAVRLAP